MKDGSVLLAEYLESIKTQPGYEWLSKYSISVYEDITQNRANTIYITTVSSEQPTMLNGASYLTNASLIFITGNFEDISGGVDNSVTVREDSFKLFKMIHSQGNINDTMFNFISTNPYFFQTDEDNNICYQITTTFNYWNN